MKTKLIPIIIFFGILAVYTYTLAPSVAPQGDSGELVTVAYTLGIAHPPGYPLFTLLGNIFTHIPFGSIAARVNFLSSVCHSLAAVFVYLIIKKLTKNTFAGVLTALILAFSYTFWLYGLVAEVFALNDLIILTLIYLALFPKRFFLMGLVFGLGLSNHHTVIMVLPVLFILLRKNIKVSSILAGSSGLIIGLLPYLYLILRANSAIVPIAWDYPTNLESLIRMFLRADYGTLVAYSGSDPALATIYQKLLQIVYYFRFVIDDFGFFGFAIFIFGLFYCLRKFKSLVIGLIIGIFFLTYANFPLEEYTGTTLSIVERFYLFPNIFVVIIVGLALDWILKRTSTKPIIRLLVPVFVVFYLITLFYQNFYSVNQNDNYLTLKLGKDILDSAPKDSIVILQGDIPAFSSFYARYVENYRPDIEIFTENQGLPTNKFRYLKKAKPKLNLEWPKVASPSGFISSNYLLTPIYVYGDLPSLVLEYKASPSGFLFKIFAKDDLEDPSVWAQNILKLNNNYVPLLRRNNYSITDKVVVGTYSLMEARLGFWCETAKNWACAKEFYLKSLEYDPSFSRTYYSLGRVYAQEKKCDAASLYFNKSLALSPQSKFVYDDLIGLAKECYKNNNLANYYQTMKDKVNSSKPLDLKEL